MLEKIKEIVKKKKFFVLALIVIWIITIVLTLSAYKTSLGKESIGNENSEVIKELTKDVSVKETVVSKQGSDSVSIMLSTYARNNKGNVNIVITGVNSNYEYANETIGVNDIQDNAFLTIGLNEKLDIKKDTQISIEINSNSEKDKSIGIRYSKDKTFNNSKLEINGEEVQGELTFKYLVNNSKFKSFSNIVVTLSIVFISLLILLVIFCDKLEIIFSSSVLLIGIIFMIIITPMSAPDEQTHYEYSLQVSNYVTFKEDTNVVDKAYLDYRALGGHINVSSAYERIYDEFNDPLKLTNKLKETTHDMEDAYKVCFLPQVIGLLLGKLLKLNFLKTFYLGRLTNLLFFAGCTYLAIKKTPILKSLFGVIACLPMFIQQAASFSYDAFVNGLSLVLIAYFINWYFSEKEITKKDKIIVFVVSLVIAPCKIVYSLFSLLFWFVPASKFKTKKDKIITLLIISIPAVIQIIGLFVPNLTALFKALQRGKAKDDIAATNNTNIITSDTEIIVEEEVTSVDEIIPYTIGHVIRHPQKSFLIYYRTIRYNIKKWFYESIGKALSGLSLILPMRLVHLFVVILGLSAFIGGDYVLPISIKMAFIVVCLVVGMFILTGMLLSWTDQEDYFIQGIQGRYFSPLLPYFISIFNNGKLKLPAKINKYLIYVQLLLLFEVIIYVLSYTFVN